MSMDAMHCLIAPLINLSFHVARGTAAPNLYFQHEYVSADVVHSSSLAKVRIEPWRPITSVNACRHYWRGYPFLLQRLSNDCPNCPNVISFFAEL